MIKLTEKRKTGNLGENLACRFLMKHGYEIIEKNYLKKCGEIDIIARNMGKIHFIEVKSVTSVDLSGVREITSNVSGETNENNNYRPEDNLHPWKLQRLANTIQIYLAEKHVSSETEWIFDVITVYIDKRQLISRIFMLENIIL